MRHLTLRRVLEAALTSVAVWSRRSVLREPECRKVGNEAAIGTADRGCRLADRHTARGLSTGDDAGNGTVVGDGVGAAVGDGIDMAVGDECGTVVGNGSSTVVGDGIGMCDDAGIGTADRGWRLADRDTARGLSAGEYARNSTAVCTAIGAAVGDEIDTAVGDESARSSATEAARSSATGSAWATTPRSAYPTGVGGLPTDIRRVDAARATTTGTALTSVPELARPSATGSTRPLATKAARS